jgi:hypothetical protein
VEIEEGEGVFIHEEGRGRYEGHWMKTDDAYLRHGHGKYTEGSQWYEGDFEEDRMHGNGVFHFASGAMYEGEFNDDQFSGYGKYTFPDGTRYEGEWRTNRMHGMGLYVDEHGKEWKGEFAGGVGPGLHRSFV